MPPGPPPLLIIIIIIIIYYHYYYYSQLLLLRTNLDKYNKKTIIFYGINHTFSSGVVLITRTNDAGSQ